MKTIQYIKIKPIGSFSSIQGKQEFTPLEYRENDVVCKAKGKRMKWIIQYDSMFNFKLKKCSKKHLNSIFEAAKINFKIQ